MVDFFIFSVPQTGLYIPYTLIWWGKENIIPSHLVYLGLQIHTDNEGVKLKGLSSFRRLSLGFE